MLAAAALVLLVPPAEAQKRTAGDRPTGRMAVKTLPGPVLAIVSLARQRIWVYGSAGLVAQSAVSTGMEGHRTPTGVFSVVQKKQFHRSNIYSNAPMPYMQRITWSGIALHAGVVPGYPASHGCIRLPHQFAVELWGMTRVGARVVVVPDDPSVFDIEHPRLPEPAVVASPADANRAPPLGPKSEAAESLAPGIVGVAHADPVGAEPAMPVKLLSPLERAKAARRHAVIDAAAKAKAAKAAVQTSALKAAAANRAIAAMRMAELARAAALARRDAAAKALQDAPEATQARTRALAEAEARLAAAGNAADTARAEEAVKTPEAIAHAKAAWQAEQANIGAIAALKATERNTEPITVLVSKKAGKVYIRQAWAPIHEAPANFKDPELPLGTHVYVAKAAEENGKALRWLSVSLPPAGQPPPTAAAVLERFELEEETRALIADRLWAGASLIVSDEAMSRETGATTDFIVLTR